ncbi:zf-C3HC4 and/or NHL domain containing protein [Asbolus verrucosus]|uniref:Zf-C3HC4 and/or NHL domain containing protein n=1 Tax=Asbolus verrucosus TaxID=1661398 RepID=A0A482VAI8_ASBVE|nr:zf-C3HC4 and/or NHL domain containing protein [Asbolus verrucosus]
MGDSDKVIKRTKSQSESFAKSKNAKQSIRLKRQPRLQRQDSIGAIEELVQCGICLEKLTDPKMLPCQHTFCLACLQSHLTAHRILIKQRSLDDQIAASKRPVAIKCPVCQKKVNLEKGMESLKELPKNLYIDSVLKLMDGNVSPISSKANDNRCVKCQIFSQQQEQCCQHCMQVFCNVCWNEHLSELESNLSILSKQVDESTVRLEHKLENFENRCEQLVESIKEATLHKIELIKMDEKRVLEDVASIKREGRVNYNSIHSKIQEMKDKLSSDSFGTNPGKVFSFINLHRETSRLLTLVNHYGEARVIFDPELCRLDQDTEGIYNDVEENETVNSSRTVNSLERFEVASQYYRNRSFVPNLVWKKCPRPANVGVPPWDNSLLYIAATDTHTVLILNRERRKLEGRLSSSEMLYPQGIAFSKKYKEIYISDKWKHCIHVFSKSGEYLRDMLVKGNGLGAVRSPDGLAMGPNEELIICDSGNDRIILVNCQTGEHLSTIGLVNNKTTLNMPTGVALSGDKIIVADTGNHRIKIFYLDGRKLHEFGALGRGKGQFRSAEVVAVDPSGFILVGDGGNARIQIFKPDGSVVKAFGGSSQGDDGFGWVSGIFVTPEMDIIAADSKKRCLRIF